MGLSPSKAHPKVTRVAPVPGQGDVPALTALHGLPGEPGQPWGKPIFHLELPPLRETWYGRASAGEGWEIGNFVNLGLTGAVGLLAEVWGGC